MPLIPNFYRQSLAAGATKARIALNLGQILTDKGEYAKAEPLLRRVVALNPDYPIARNALAHLLYKQGKTKEATEMLVGPLKVEFAGVTQSVWNFHN